MAAPAHVAGDAKLTAPIGGASLSAVRLMPTYPTATLFPSGPLFPGHTYIPAGLAESAIQHTL